VPSVFISYSHKDESLKAKLEAQLSTLKNEGLIEAWHDRRIKAGDDFNSSISAELDRAGIILLLVSPDFLASPYINDVEIKRAMQRHSAGEARVIPVILRDCDWRTKPFGRLAAAPKEGKPVKSWSRIDAAFLNVVEMIRAVLQSPDDAGKIHIIEAESKARQFEKDVATDVSYYTAKLGSWPAVSLNGEELIEPLRTTLKKVEENREYRERNRNIWATLYRMFGGASLIHSKLEMGEKLRLALPYLRQSRDLWPEQRGLKENVVFLETFARNQGGDVKQYLTNVLQILRGPDDPQIPMLVDRLANAANSPEQQAQSWLLNKATPNPIWNFLQGVQFMLKKEKNIDAEIEVTTKPQQDGRVEVQAKIGPNVFLWDVNFANKTFDPKNELTVGFMGLIASAKG
jgi:hypothetical protein